MDMICEKNKNSLFLAATLRLKLFIIKNMATLKQLVLLFLFTGVLGTLGKSLPSNNAGKILLISKIDIGSILKNLTTENQCGKLN